MCEAVERLINKEKAKVRAEANKKLKLEKAKAEKRLKAEKAKAKEKEIRSIKNMFKAGATIEMIAQGFSISPEAVQSLII